MKPCMLNAELIDCESGLQYSALHYRSPKNTTLQADSSRSALDDAFSYFSRNVCIEIETEVGCVLLHNQCLISIQKQLKEMFRVLSLDDFSEMTIKHFSERKPCQNEPQPLYIIHQGY